MKRFYTIAVALVVAFSFGACDSFVESVDDPINLIADELLTNEAQVPFVIKGVQSRFSTTYDRLAMFAGGISDELIFDQRVPNATFPTYQEMDEGDITFANNSNDGVYNDLGELRFFADNLVSRAGEISFEDAALQQEAQFTGNFFGGIARYFYATYYGLTARQGGGVITEDPAEPGPFIPADQMYAQALARLETARGLADATYTRIINTLIARIYLFQENYSAAATAAAGGMTQGDDPFESLHSVDNTNVYWSQAGPGRHQWVVDFIYKDFVDADPTEANRIQLAEITGNDDPPTTFYRQDRYSARDTPLPFATWQENELMLAELDVRGGDAGGALTRVNTVRSAYGLEPLDSVDLAGIELERRKELWTMGLRLPDQRRFGTWHLGPGTWWYLPITQSERNINPNIGS